MRVVFLVAMNVSITLSTQTHFWVVWRQNEQSFPAFISVTSQDVSSSVHNVRTPVASLHHENKVLASKHRIKNKIEFFFLPVLFLAGYYTVKISRKRLKRETK